MAKDIDRRLRKFEDALVNVLKKYGLAGLIAGGAAHFSTQQVDHDPFATQ